MIKTRSTTIEFESGLKVDIEESGKIYIYAMFVDESKREEFFEDINAVKELVEKKQLMY